MRYQKGKVKKKIPFKIIFKNLGINLTKEVKDVYTENYKTLIIKDDSKRWKCIPSSWIKRVTIIKMTILTQGNLQIQCNPYQNTKGVFHGTRTNNFKIL